jgi:nucleotide-binding universal stress UspA family protein
MTQTAIKRVVVGVDGSDNSAAALEWAIQFAHLTGAEIVAVFAISPTSAVEYVGPAAFGPFPAVPPELDPAWRSAATQEFEQEWCRKLRDSKAAHQMIVEEGPPAMTLAGVADKVDAYLVVVGRTGKGEIAELVLGSVSHQLAQQCKRPVLLVSAT